MRFIIQVILTSTLSYFLQQVMPPWVVVLVAAFISWLISNTLLTAFWGGFVALSLLWMIMATMIDVYTHSVLSLKIAPLLGLKSPIVLIVLTGFTGGILGGLGAICGQHLLRLSRRRKSNVYKF
jgi:hypothetical protein